jgi:hypothetical protein
VFLKWERKEAISPFDDFALYPHASFFRPISFFTVRIVKRRFPMNYTII